MDEILLEKSFSSDKTNTLNGLVFDQLNKFLIRSLLMGNIEISKIIPVSINGEIYDLSLSSYIPTYHTKEKSMYVNFSVILIKTTKVTSVKYKVLPGSGKLTNTIFSSSYATLIKKKLINNYSIKYLKKGNKSGIHVRFDIDHKLVKQMREHFKPRIGLRGKIKLNVLDRNGVEYNKLLDYNLKNNVTVRIKSIVSARVSYFVRGEDRSESVMFSDLPDYLNTINRYVHMFEDSLHIGGRPRYVADIISKCNINELFVVDSGNLNMLIYLLNLESTILVINDRRVNKDNLIQYKDKL